MQNKAGIELLHGFDLFVTDNKLNCVWFSVENYKDSITKERLIKYREFGFSLYIRSVDEK